MFIGCRDLDSLFRLNETFINIPLIIIIYESVSPCHIQLGPKIKHCHADLDLYQIGTTAGDAMV